MQFSLNRMTKGQISAGAIAILDNRGCEVWIQNNLPVPGRKFIGRPGIADISGFIRANGIRVECEVKADGDSLSDAQIQLLTELHKAGGWALIAIQNMSGFVEVLPFTLLKTQ